MECSKGPQGKELYHKLGEKMGYTKEKGMYGYTLGIPHVTINGRKNLDYFDDLGKFKEVVCSLIEGPTPDTCS